MIDKARVDAVHAALMAEHGNCGDECPYPKITKDGIFTILMLGEQTPIIPTEGDEMHITTNEAAPNGLFVPWTSLPAIVRNIDLDFETKVITLRDDAMLCNVRIADGWRVEMQGQTTRITGCEMPPHQVIRTD